MEFLCNQVIMSQATHLYFDHPQEPSPEERGFYWATRYTDTKKAFYFQPDDLWANVDITRFGEPLTLSTVCGDNNVGCPSLLKRENVVGESGLCLKSKMARCVCDLWGILLMSE